MNYRFLPLIISSLILCSSVIVIGQSETSWENAQVLSEETGKPILVKFSFDTCKPCKQLQAEVFDNVLLRARIDSHFHVVHYDIYKENIALEKKFGIDAYPETVIVNSKDYNKSDFRIGGYSNPQIYLTRLFSYFDSEQNNEEKYSYGIPAEYSKYKEDDDVLRELVHHVFDDLNYYNEENTDPFGIFEEFFYRDNVIDTLYVKVITHKLYYHDDARKWFLKNEDELKEKFGVKFMRQQPYENILEYDIESPTVLKSHKTLYKRNKKIADKLTKYLGESKNFRDSIYYRKVFMTNYHLTELETPDFLNDSNETLLTLLRYQNADEWFLEEFYNQILILTLQEECNHKVAEIIKSIEANKLYSKLPAFVELQAIAYYRLNQQDVTVAKIREANDIARQERMLFKQSFTMLKEHHLLTLSKHDCKN